MDCETIQRNRVAEAYEAGALPSGEAEAYERHYFECDACFAKLEELRGLARRLKATAAELFAEEMEAERLGRLREHAGETAPPPVRARRLVLPRPSWSRLLRPAWATGFAAVAAAVVLLLAWSGHARHTERLRELWTPRPHPYIPTELRGIEDDAGFRLGIELYRSGRYAEAIEPLREVARREPGSKEARFYLGLSLFLAGRPGEARRALEVAARGAAPSSAAVWYLAQAELHCGRERSAAPLLRRVAGSGGLYAPAADSLLARLEQARRR